MPEVVLKLHRNFESPENVTCCLKETFEQPSKREILLHLSGKELTKVLLALGKPGLDGKKKTCQVDVLLAGSELIFATTDESWAIPETSCQKLNLALFNNCLFLQYRQTDRQTDRHCK